MKTTKCVFIILYILNFVNKEIIIPTFRKPNNGIVVQLLRCYNATELLIFLINIHNIGLGTILIEPFFKKFEHFALPDAALTDEDKHHATINQAGYLLCILCAGYEFHRHEIYCKYNKLYFAKPYYIAIFWRLYHENSTY